MSLFGYIGHHLIVAIIDHIPNGWGMTHDPYSTTPNRNSQQIIPITQQALGHVGTAELDERSR